MFLILISYFWLQLNIELFIRKFICDLVYIWSLGFYIFICLGFKIMFDDMDVFYFDVMFVFKYFQEFGDGSFYYMCVGGGGWVYFFGIVFLVDCYDVIIFL